MMKPLAACLLLLALASAVDSAWDALIRAVLGALVLFTIVTVLVNRWRKRRADAATLMTDTVKATAVS